MIEVVKLHSDGFKELDGGGDTGFDKDDVGLTLRANTDRGPSDYHRVELKLGYGDEISHETYTGLTTSDFANNAYRRYAATALDRMKWDHERFLLSHHYAIGGHTSLNTQIYHHRFARTWRKLNGFDNPSSLHDILAAPQSGNHGVFYAILTGAADSTSPEEALLIGTNDRRFYSQGIQTSLQSEQSWFRLNHSISAGLRLHRDAIDRLHTEEPYLMMQRTLMPENTPIRVTRDAVGSALAFAAYARDEIMLGPVRVSGGLRTEIIATAWDDAQDAGRNNHHLETVFIPGAGVFYQPLPWLGLLAGVHKGFVPGAPSPTGTAPAEESVNYEAGFRAGASWGRVEVIGFFNDYSNLKGSCTFSSGCTENQIDEEFSAGNVHIFGVEAGGETQLYDGATFRAPLRLSYTFSHSVFRRAFPSSNPEWGNVESGFELPYLPQHLLSAELGARAQSWEIDLSGRYIGTMRDVAGNGPLVDGNYVPAYFQLDATAHYRFGDWGEAYLTVWNLLDDQHIVSLRPFGARPGAPRTAVLGYKNSF
jgi:Fe(3+) dicitrate transport protein